MSSITKCASWRAAAAAAAASSDRRSTNWSGKYSIGREEQARRRNEDSVDRELAADERHSNVTVEVLNYCVVIISDKVVAVHLSSHHHEDFIVLVAGHAEGESTYLYTISSSSSVPLLLPPSYSLPYSQVSVPGSVVGNSGQFN